MGRMDRIVRVCRRELRWSYMADEEEQNKNEREKKC